MSTPPPLPPQADAASPDPPRAVRAESLWEFHADESILDAAFGLDSRVRVIDALGTYTIVDAQGREQHAVHGHQPLRAACLLPSGAAVLLRADGKLTGLDDHGVSRFEIDVPAATCVGANARGIAIGSQRHPVRWFSPSGRQRAQCTVEHPVAFIAPCSPEGHLVALSPSGQFSVVLGEHLLWRLHLRSNASALAATESGLFAVAHRDGAQVFSIEGTMVGLFDVGRPVRAVALAADAPLLLLLDDEERLYLVDLATGYSTWRETRPRGQQQVRLSRDGTRALAVSSAGGVELLGFRRGQDRAERLELIGRHAPAGDGIWRHVSATIDGVPPSSRFAVDPQATLVALGRDEGLRIELLDSSGGLVTSLPGLADLASIQFSPEGRRLYLLGRRSVASVLRDGSDRFTISGSFSHVLPGPDASFVLVSTSPATVRMHAGRDCRAETRLPGAAVHVLGAPDLSRVAIADSSGALTVWSHGVPPWRRPHEARAGSLALGGPGLVACEGAEVVGLRPDGSEAWRALPPQRVELVRLDDEVIARDATNRFFRFGERGEMTALDARPNLGHSQVLSSLQGLLELNVNGRVITAFRPDGSIAWRCEAPDVVPPQQIVARRDLVVFRAGQRLCLLALRSGCAVSDVAGRAAFLEL